MSGILNVLASAGSASSYTVTVAENATGIFGYNPGSSPPGAISSTAFKTTTINNVGSRTPTAGSANDIVLVLAGSLTQAYFSSLLVQSTSGAVRRYLTSAATFSVIGGTLSAWTWDNDDPVWTATGSRFLQLFP